jgi:hypothetical protein
MIVSKVGGDFYDDDAGLIDIAFNICDKMYAGIYNGNEKHPGDLGLVLERAQRAGIEFSDSSSRLLCLSRFIAYHSFGW